MADDPLFKRFGKAFQAGTVLFREGEPGNEMYVVQSGKVRISVTVRKVEKVLVDLGAGEFFGEMSILNGAPRSATATVVEDSTLMVIDPRTFDAMVRGSAEIAIRMIKKLAGRLQEADDQISNLMLRDHTSRVVHSILSLCRKGQQDEGGIRIRTTPEDLGAKIGLEREQIDAVLQRLDRANLVLATDDGLHVSSEDRLREFLGFLEMKEKFGDL
ncbi:MAG: Crp/Fnr family transcriptional regulator [Pseudomonadota bacterium]